MNTRQKFAQWVGNITIVVVIVLLISGWAKPGGLTNKGVIIVCYAAYIVEEVHFTPEGKEFCDKIVDKA